VGHREAVCAAAGHLLCEGALANPGDTVPAGAKSVETTLTYSSGSAGKVQDLAGEAVGKVLDA